MDYFFHENDHFIEVRKVKDHHGQVLEDAIVTAQIVNYSFEPVEGEEWPLTLEHQGGGTYRSEVLSDAVDLEDNRQYILLVNVDHDVGKAQFETEIGVSRRNNKGFFR